MKRKRKQLFPGPAAKPSWDALASRVNDGSGITRTRRSTERTLSKTPGPQQKIIDLAKLTKASRKALPASDFVFPKTRRYPIHDKAHAHAALIDSLGKPEHAIVVAAVRKRYGWMK